MIPHISRSIDYLTGVEPNRSNVYYISDKYLQSFLFRLPLRVDLCHVHHYSRTLTLASVLAQASGTLVLNMRNLHIEIAIKEGALTAR